MLLVRELGLGTATSPNGLIVIGLDLSPPLAFRHCHKCLC